MDKVATQGQRSDDGLGITIRQLKASDYPQFKDIQDTVYAQMYGAWPLKKFNVAIMTFPQGQLGAIVDNKLVGVSLSFRLEKEDVDQQHVYSEITSNGYLCQHKPQGKILYGIECVVNPKYRRKGIGRALYEARNQLCRELGIERIVFGGRIPGYHKVAQTLSPEDYVKEVMSGERVDPVFRFQLNQGFDYRGILHKYQPGDNESKACAAFLQKYI